MTTRRDDAHIVSTTGKGASLFDVNAAEAAHAIDVERLSTFSRWRIVSTNTSESRLHSGSHAHVFVDTDFHATEAAFHFDDGAVEQVGASQIKTDEAEAGLHIGALESLTAEVELLLTESGVDFAYLTTVLVNQFQVVNRLVVSIMDTKKCSILNV